MRPVAYRLTWRDASGFHSVEHSQRAHVRGLRIMRLACADCFDVSEVMPIFKG